MKNKINLLLPALFLLIVAHSSIVKSQDKTINDSVHILFLHHSTGHGVWKGKNTDKDAQYGELEELIVEYNQLNEKKINIVHQSFPKSKPYGWKNYPYDYYNIWVKHGNDSFYMDEPTLKYLASHFDVIIFKHCFPVSNIVADDSLSSVDSDKKTIGNYKLQYNALKDKMHQYPDTKFIVWTGAALNKEKTTEDNGERAREFFHWVKLEWNQDGDNIYIWDFWELETEGGIYLKDEYARRPADSHPNSSFNSKASKFLAKRIIDVIENNGKRTNQKGETLD